MHLHSTENYSEKCPVFSGKLEKTVASLAKNSGSQLLKKQFSKQSPMKPSLTTFCVTIFDMSSMYFDFELSTPISRRDNSQHNIPGICFSGQIQPCGVEYILISVYHENLTQEPG